MTQSEQIRDAVETTVQRLLREGEADLVRDARPAFEASDLDESQWEAWVDAWIDAAYEQHALRLSAVDFECYVDWCTCGDSRADHHGHCARADCDCLRFTRSRKSKRPTPRVCRGSMPWKGPSLLARQEAGALSPAIAQLVLGEELR